MNNTNLLSGAASAPVAPTQVDMVPPATGRDRWMYEQGRLAERDLRTSKAAPVAPAPQPAAFGDEKHVLVPQMLLSAACSAIDKKRDGTKVLAEFRRYTVGDLSAAAPKADHIADASKMVPAPLQQGEYPGLPQGDVNTGVGEMWNRHSMRAYLDADRAARAAQLAPVEVHDPKCPALIGDACACERHEPAVDKAWARFCGGIGDGPNAPYPGMIGAFERYYGQSFADKDWRSEASVWAAAWKARDNQPAATTQPAAPQGDVAAWLVLADGEPHHVTPGKSDDAARLWAEDQTKCGAPYSFTFLPLCPPAAQPQRAA